MGLKQADGRVQVVRASENTYGIYESDPYIVDYTSLFEAESKEEAQRKAEMEMRGS